MEKESLIKRVLYLLLISMAKYAFPNKSRIFLYKVAGVKIGEKVFIGRGLNIIDYYYAHLIEIGDRASLSPNVTLIVSASPNNSQLNKYYPKKIKGIKIGNDVWIGAGVHILPGVSIGKMSIIGTGAVVTNDVPQGSIMVGVPAKILKKLVLRV